MIKESINFNINTTKDFWLHRYSSAKYIDTLFQNKCLNIRFTTALNFKDAYEGWGFKNRRLKGAIDDATKFYNRVTVLDSGKVESIYCMLKNYIEDYTDLKIDEVKSIAKLFKKYNDKRKATFLSCWFKTDALEEENRAMWKLYGNNENGIRISIKWSHLKKQLERLNESFEVGFVNYGNKKELNNLFFIKDISYKHENEFRLSFYKQKKKNEYVIPFEGLVKLYCTVRSEKHENIINNQLDAFGFSTDKHAKLIRQSSNLTFESNQVDWEDLLEKLNQEIITRKL